MADMNLKLILELDDRGAIKGIRDADGNLIRLGRDGGQAGAEIAGGMSKAKQGIVSISEQLGAMRRQIMSLIGIGFGAQMARDILRTADAYKEVTARLQVASRSAGDAARAYRALNAIARDTRADWGATLHLYSRLARSTKELNVSQADLLTVTKAINQAIVVSGASAQEAGAALIQLGQGMASGTLRGDELRSVIEQMPRLAEMIAKGMGVSLGQLRQLGEQGALTTQAVIAAIRNQAGAVQAEFERMPPTVSQAMTQIRNSFTIWLGEMDKASGSTSLMAAGLMAVADNMDLAARATIGLSAAMLTLKANTKLAAAGFAGLGRAVGLVGAAFAGWEIGTALANKFAVVRQAGVMLVYWLKSFLADIKAFVSMAAENLSYAITHPLDALRMEVASLAESVASGLSSIGLDGVAKGWREIAAAMTPANKAAEEHRRKLAAINAEYVNELGRIDQITKALMVEAGRQPEKTGAPRPSGGGAPVANPLSELRRQQQQQEREQLRQHLEQKLAMLETSLMSETERENQAYQNRLSMLAQAHEMGVVDDLRYQALQAQLAEQHEQRLTEIKAQGEQQRLQLMADSMNQALTLQGSFAQLFQDASRVNLSQLTDQLGAFAASSKQLWQQSWKGKLAVMQGGLAMASSLMESHNRRQFELGKAAAVANATVSTAQGIAEALKWGFPMGPIFAGIIGAAGALQIAKIASTQFGSKGAGSAGIPAAGVGGGAPTVAINPASGLPSASAPPQSSPQMDQQPIIINNYVKSDTGYVDPQALQTLAESLQTHLEQLNQRGAGGALRAA